MSSTLATLIELSKVDTALARIFVQKKQLETKLAEREAVLKRAQTERNGLAKLTDERRTRYNTEDKTIKEEHEKIGERRKVLNTLHNYKLQQAAIREIDYNVRQLKVREDLLLKMLDEADQAEAALKKSEAQLATIQAEVELLRSDSAENLVALESQRTEKSKARDTILPKVLPANLQQYDRVKNRYPADPMVPVNNGSCSGCYIQVAAQLMVNVHKGDSVVKCRGCGRFIYLDGVVDPTPTSSNSSASSVTS